MFSPDGKRVVTCSYDKTARVWDAATGQAVSLPMQHADNVAYAAFGPDGLQVVTVPGSSSFSGQAARVWNAATGKPVTEPLVQDGLLHSATFSPDGKWVAVGGSQNLQMWDASTGTAGTRLSGTTIYAGYEHVSFHPGGKYLAATEGPCAHLWDLQTGKELKQIKFSWE
jgi:WD40 repeat protein